MRKYHYENKPRTTHENEIYPNRKRGLTGGYSMTQAGYRLFQ